MVRANKNGLNFTLVCQDYTRKSVIALKQLIRLKG